MCFHRFCETWIQQHRVHLQQLLSVPRNQHQLNEPMQHDMPALVDRVVTHYENYYRAKSLAAKHDVLSVFSPAWAPSLERALSWIGGWRPTAAFHLIYSESGLRFEAQLHNLLRGLRSGDLGDLSPSQLARVSELQCETVREENEITDEMGELQEGLGDPFLDMGGLIQGLEKVLKRADDLRLGTIRMVVEILSPLQAVDFLISAAELQIGIHEWGLKETGSVTLCETRYILCTNPIVLCRCQCHSSFNVRFISCL